MAEIVPLQDPTNYRRVRERIRKLWDEGEVEFSTHAQTRMKERSLDVTDVQHVVRYGQIVEHSRPKELWRYAIEGKTVDATRLRVVVEIDGTLIIVTVVSRG